MVNGLQSLYRVNPKLYFLFYRLRNKYRCWTESSEFKHFRERKDAEYLLISPTNCGRTWLRIMLGKLLCLTYNINYELVNYHDLYSLHDLNPYVPSFKAIHERFGQFGGTYENKKVILLVRDPRDAIISRYFQHEYTPESTPLDLHNYIFEQKALEDYYISFYEGWQKNKDVPADLMLLRYEDLKADPHKELKRIMEFMKIETTDAFIKEAIDYASFENMKKAELEGSQNIRAGVMNTSGTGNSESLKVRKGKVGGYRDYLSEAEIKEMNNIINSQLPPEYGYNYS